MSKERKLGTIRPRRSEQERTQGQEGDKRPYASEHSTARGWLFIDRLRSELVNSNSQFSFPVCLAHLWKDKL